MSQDVGSKWKPHSIYNHVRENKRGDLVRARQNLGITTPAPGKNIDMVDNFESIIDEYSVSESIILDDQSVNQDNDYNEYSNEWFHLKLTRTEWEEIKPIIILVQVRE